MKHGLKNIIVRFYSVTANEEYFEDFVSICYANIAAEKEARVFSYRDKKYLLKVQSLQSSSEHVVFFLSVVRERNTWQARAQSSGKLSGISINQGFIGDPYYYLIHPKNKIIYGFTTGPNASLKSTASILLQQFNRDRKSKISLEQIVREPEFSKFRTFTGYNSLRFKIDASQLDDTDEDAPDFIRQLSASHYLMNNSEISLTISDIGESGFSEKELFNLVMYLSESDGCSALTVQGMDGSGERTNVSFTNAYLMFRTQIETRENYISEEKALPVLLEAFRFFDTPS